jgi:hypothetical protein
MTEPHCSLPVSPPLEDALHRDLLDVTPPPFVPNSVPPLEEGPDPFDPERLRLSPEMTASLGLKRALLTIPVRRPAREWFFRTHENKRYHLHTLVLELKEDRETYLIAPDLREEIVGEPCVRPCILVSCVTRQGKFFFWPLRPPESSGRRNDWTQSAIDAVTIAMKKWIRLRPDLELGAYEVIYAEHLAADPVWPEMDMAQLLRIAFKGKYIDHYDHVVLQQLRG